MYDSFSNEACLPVEERMMKTPFKLIEKENYSFYYIKNIERLSFMGMQILYTINS